MGHMMESRCVFAAGSPFCFSGLIWRYLQCSTHTAVQYSGQRLKSRWHSEYVQGRTFLTHNLSPISHTSSYEVLHLFNIYFWVLCFFTSQHIEGWLSSRQDHERERAVRTAAEMLHFYLDHLSVKVWPYVTPSIITRLKSPNLIMK